MNSEQDTLAIETARAIMSADKDIFSELEARRVAKMTYVEQCMERLLPFLPSSKRGPKKAKNWNHDYGIAHAVHVLKQKGYKVYRNRKRKKQGKTACEIVADALRPARNISYQGVEAIYGRVLKFESERTGRLRPKNN